MILHNLVRYSILFAIAVLALGLAWLFIKLLVHTILLVAGVVFALFAWKKYGSKSYTRNPFKL
jgi:energy-converting hydrogenase Eha subunit A